MKSVWSAAFKYTIIVENMSLSGGSRGLRGRGMTSSSSPLRVLKGPSPFGLSKEPLKRLKK